jgi:2-desacetyl-2-hydroxyethyl bacteriochlorophyllide A dehydrogenase
MKILTCHAPRKLVLEDQHEPALKKGQAIIRIRRIGVCGTDLHAYEGTQPFLSYPRVLGHELAGELIAFDHAPGFARDEIVSVMPYFNCGNCIACRKGTPNCCVNMMVCGVHVDGGMAEYLSVPASTLVHGNGLSLDELALVEPLAIGAHGVRRAAVCQEEFVLVIGAGPIGLGTMAFAGIAGARVIAMDVNEGRLQYCREKLGVIDTLNPRDADPLAALREITGGDMPSVVIDATGNLHAINDAFRFMAHGGRYVLVGLQGGDIVVNHPEFHKREGTLMSSRNATRQDFGHVIRAIMNRDVRPDEFITHRVSFDNAASQFEHWLNPDSHVIKAMITL